MKDNDLQSKVMRIKFREEVLRQAYFEGQSTVILNLALTFTSNVFKRKTIDFCTDSLNILKFVIL